MKKIIFLRTMIILLLFIFLIITYLICFIFKFGYIEKKETIFSYNINKDIKYKVYLYDNNFIESKILGENLIYISNLVKKIEVEYNYLYDADKSTDITFSYDIRGNIISNIIENLQEKELWNKTYIYEKDKVNIKDKQFLIKKIITIDLQDYIDELNKFKQTFRISTINKLYINFIISAEGIYNNEKIYDKQQLILELPLGNDAFYITKNNLDSTNSNIEINKQKFVLPYLIISLILSIINIFIILTIFKLYKVLIIQNRKIDKFTKKINKIIKQYGDIIVEIMNDVDIINHKEIIVKNFNQMVDLEYELKIPITLYRTDTKAVFCLIHDDIIYKYILDKK